MQNEGSVIRSPHPSRLRRATFSKGAGKGAGHTHLPPPTAHFGRKAKNQPPRGRRSDGHAGNRQTATSRAIRPFADAKGRAQ
jgi:hypothetical protein